MKTSQLQMIHDQRQLINKTRQLPGSCRCPALRTLMFDFPSKPTSVLPPTSSPSASIKRQTIGNRLGRGTQLYVRLISETALWQRTKMLLTWRWWRCEGAWCQELGTGGSSSRRCAASLCQRRRCRRPLWSERTGWGWTPPDGWDPDVSVLTHGSAWFAAASPHLDSGSHLFGQLHVQALLAGVQTVDHILVLQLPGADHQPGQVAAEELSHPGIATWLVAGSGGGQIKQPKKTLEFRCYKLY